MGTISATEIMRAGVNLKNITIYRINIIVEESDMFENFFEIAKLITAVYILQFD